MKIILSKMSTSKLLFLLVAILFLMQSPGAGAANSATNQPFTAHYENVLGTSLEIKVVASSEPQSQKAQQAVLAEIDRESHILSSWDPRSEFSRWFQTKGQPVNVSPELFEVLALFDQWRERTQGALDASAEV